MFQKLDHKHPSVPFRLINKRLFSLQMSDFNLKQTHET